ncbi:MAG: prepilin-type N-terminal cleavage/methylation domain-containing protein [Verrucomicrobiales bacterium]|nr:prepilin-type N-terminal cleavage/methylation domain-containing protein [Verrucomicrobiales bacterium]
MNSTLALQNVRSRGFTLLEMLLALTLFGMAVVPLVRALARTSQMAVESQMDARMQMRLQSKLTEISKLTNLAEWDGQTQTTEADELGVWTVTQVEQMKQITNEDGQEVTQLYRIYVQAFYHVDWKTEPEMMDAEIWRYQPLYRTQGGPAIPPGVR